MIHSMTAFSRIESDLEPGVFIWEIRSFNHRFLDLQFRLPEVVRSLEPQIRQLTREKLCRGKVEIALNIVPHTGRASTENDEALHINTTLLNQLSTALRKAHENLELPPSICLELLKWPGVLQDRQAFNPSCQTQILESFKQALDQLIQNRNAEGSALLQTLSSKLPLINNILKDCEQLIPEILQLQKNKLKEKIEAIGQAPDMNRLEQELVYFAQKTDITEEMDRTKAHVAEIDRTLKAGGPAGRKLDFLMQELNREANTLGAKSASLKTTQASMTLKVIIEQMREQVQNIE